MARSKRDQSKHDEEKVDHEAEQVSELLGMRVEKLTLSVRSRNSLKVAGIKVLADLVQRTKQEMLKYRNFGPKSLSELTDILENLGLQFGMDITPYLKETEGAEEEQERVTRGV